MKINITPQRLYAKDSDGVLQPIGIASSGATESLAYIKQYAEDRIEQVKSEAPQLTTLTSQVAGKVDKVTGKGLSANDYDAAAKAKVDAIPANPKYTDTVYDDTVIQGQVSSLNKDITDLDDRVSMLEEVSAIDNFSDIAKVVRAGRASKYFNIGDQIIVPWSDGTTTYQMPFDVVHFGNVELENGSTVPGMYLESHYLTPFGVQFDANEAFYYCESALPAGTYYITAANNWGSNIVSGESYQFTTTQEVPAGGHLVMEQGAVDKSFANWRVYSYANGATTTPIETITPVKGMSGTKLGDWSGSAKYSTSGMNNMQRSNYGYNRWGQSGIRQWLNSDKAAGQWWSARNVFDRAPIECASKRGFLAGFGSDFLGAIKPVKTVTALNMISDTTIGESEVTYDKFFLASLEQEYCEPQASGVEGDAWEYWKQTLPQKHNYGVTMQEHIRYGIENKTSAQYCRLRSAYRGLASYTFNVSNSGGIAYGYDTGSPRCAPACVIC